MSTTTTTPTTLSVDGNAYGWYVDDSDGGRWWPTTGGGAMNDAVESPEETFTRLNNAGEGFDPSDEIDGWTLVHEAGTTDDVSVYMDGADVILVGTDGSGSYDSHWAVRVDGVWHS